MQCPNSFQLSRNNNTTTMVLLISPLLSYLVVMMLSLLLLLWCCRCCCCYDAVGVGDSKKIWKEVLTKVVNQSTWARIQTSAILWGIFIYWLISQKRRKRRKWVRQWPIFNVFRCKDWRSRKLLPLMLSDRIHRLTSKNKILECPSFKSCHPSYTDKILSQLTVWAPNGCQSEMWLVPVSLTKRLFRCSNGTS